MSPRAPSHSGEGTDPDIRILMDFRARHEQSLIELPTRMAHIDKKLTELTTTLRILGTVVMVALTAVEAFHWHAH